MNYLALDWGRRKVGVALADGETRVALPLLTLPHDDRFLGALADLIDTYAVSDIVVGIPSHPGHANAGEDARAMAAVVGGRFPGVRVHTVDEMFTTAMARAAMHEAGRSGGDDDAAAAAILLQGWVDGILETSRRDDKPGDRDA